MNDGAIEIAYLILNLNGHHFEVDGSLEWLETVIPEHAMVGFSSEPGEAVKEIS